MARAKKEAALTPEERLQAALVPDLEWPYKLPENWCWVYAPHIFDIEYGKGLPTKQLSDTGYPVFGANGQIGFYSEYMYKEPQALMSCRGAYSGTMNKSLPYSYVTSNSLIISSPRGLMGTDCIYYLFSALNVSELISGTAQPQVTVQAFDGFPIPLSPLAEQQRIVDRIESLFAKLDEAKEKAQAVVDSFETRKAAILHKAFTGELTAKWREENGVSSKEWTTCSLSKCCKIGSGGTPSRKSSKYYAGNIPWIKTGEIEWNEVVDSEEKISQEAIDNSSAKLYNPGAVLVAMYGMGATRGRASILGVKAATNQAVCVLQPQEHLNNRYLFYFFMCNYWSMREQAVGGNQLNLSATIIGKQNIDIPPVSEQLEIVRILDNLNAKERSTKEIAETVIEQIDTLKKAILARAFRGELGTNDQSEESALELLKRIL